MLSGEVSIRLWPTRGNENQRRPSESGDPWPDRWIPACAGMTWLSGEPGCYFQCVFWRTFLVYNDRMGFATSWLMNAVEQEAGELAGGLRRRDPALIDYLIEQYRYRLFRYLLMLTGRRHEAEDLFQETWIRVLEKGHQYQQRWKFETWLFSIARHLTIDYRRRRQPESLDALLEPGDYPPSSRSRRHCPHPRHSNRRFRVKRLRAWPRPWRICPFLTEKC